MTHLTAALVLFLQTEATPAPAPSGNAILEMIQNMGILAISVLGLLVISSLFSWTIIFGKWGSLKKAKSQSRRFLRAFRKANRLQEIAAVSEQFQPSPLCLIFDEVYEAYRRQTGGAGAPRNIAALERSAQTAASEALTNMERRLPWLATIASSSPFIGLFGTIMGIVDAFHGLGTAGSATLRAVAPGVSEALITTAAGLLVAVPALVAYNQFAASLREMAARMDDFSRELLNTLEESASGRVAHSASDYLDREPARGIHD